MADTEAIIKLKSEVFDLQIEMGKLKQKMQEKVMLIDKLSKEQGEKQ